MSIKVVVWKTILLCAEVIIADSLYFKCATSTSDSYSVLAQRADLLENSTKHPLHSRLWETTPKTHARRQRNWTFTEASNDVKNLCLGLSSLHHHYQSQQSHPCSRTNNITHSSIDRCATNPLTKNGVWNYYLHCHTQNGLPSPVWGTSQPVTWEVFDHRMSVPLHFSCILDSLTCG